MEPFSFRIAFAAATLFLLSACTRPEADTARVTVDFPATYWNNHPSGYTSNYVSNILRIANNSQQVGISSIDDELTDWANIIPTGYQSGRYDTNCFLVVATGPQLDSHACYKRDLQTGLVDSAVFYFGEMSDPTSIGRQAQLEVLAGSNRNFILLGMHALSRSDCKKLTDPSFDKSKLSKPYIIGESGPVEVTNGGENNFQIKADSINVEKYIDYCVSTQPGAITKPPVNRVAGYFELTTGLNVIPNITYNGQCFPIDLRLMDEKGLHNLQSPYTDAFRLKYDDGSLVTIYNDSFSCLNNSGAIADFRTYGNYVTRVWAKGNPSQQGSSISLFGESGGNVVVTKTSGASETLAVVKTARLYDVGPSQRVAMTSVPSKIMNDVCYPITLTAGISNFSSPSFIQASENVDVDLGSTSSVTGTLRFYDDSDCTVGESIRIDYTSALQKSYVTKYFRVRSFEPGEYFYLTHVNSASLLAFTENKIYIEEQNEVVERLAIEGPSELVLPIVNSPNPLLTANCYGPYRVHLVNNRGAAVRAPTMPMTGLRKGYSINIKYDTNLSTTLYSKPASDVAPVCDDAQRVDSNTVNSLLGAVGVFEFYVKINNYTNSASSRSRYIRPVDGIAAYANEAPLPQVDFILTIHDEESITGGQTIPPPPPQDAF